MYRARAHAGERIIERESEKERGCPLRSSLQNADKERARAAGTPPVRKGVLSSKFVYAELRTNVYIARWWQGREEGHTYIHTHTNVHLLSQDRPFVRIEMEARVALHVQRALRTELRDCQ